MCFLSLQNLWSQQPNEWKDVFLSLYSVRGCQTVLCVFRREEETLVSRLLSSTIILVLELGFCFSIAFWKWIERARSAQLGERADSSSPLVEGCVSNVPSLAISGRLSSWGAFALQFPSAVSSLEVVLSDLHSGTSRQMHIHCLSIFKRCCRWGGGGGDEFLESRSLARVQVQLGGSSSLLLKWTLQQLFYYQQQHSMALFESNNRNPFRMLLLL